MGGPVTVEIHNMETTPPVVIINYDFLSDLKFNLIGGVDGFTFTDMYNNNKGQKCHEGFNGKYCMSHS